MTLSAKSQEALDAWAKKSTWNTSDDSDMNRWYDFVDQYQKDHGNTIDEASLRELIEKTVDDDMGEDLRTIIRDRISLAYSILDFLKHTNR